MSTTFENVMIMNIEYSDELNKSGFNQIKIEFQHTEKDGTLHSKIINRRYSINRKGNVVFYFNNFKYECDSFDPNVIISGDFIKPKKYVAAQGNNVEEKENVEEIYDEQENKEYSEETSEDDMEQITEKKNGEICHKEYDTIKSCIIANVPVYLTGPAGSGKNYTIKKIAEELGLTFYFTNSVQQEYKITGFIDAGGIFHETEFYKAFKDGGLFFLDEMDASIPEVLILLNAAIANGYFEFPNGRINAHENFRVIAAGNTIGKGANEMYTGRMILDGATLDRFVVIEFNYDKNIELSIAKGDIELIEFVHELRDTCIKYDISATFSYRCIEYIVKLKSLLPLIKVLEIAIFKGMDKSDIELFEFNNPNNKYMKTAKTLIK